MRNMNLMLTNQIICFQIIKDELINLRDPVHIGVRQPRHFFYF